MRPKIRENKRLLRRQTEEGVRGKEMRQAKGKDQGLFQTLPGWTAISDGLQEPPLLLLGRKC